MSEQESWSTAQYQEWLRTGGHLPAGPQGIKRRPEEALQLTVVAYLSTHPRLPQRMHWFHVPNQKGTRSYAEMAVLKAMGVVPGVADLILMLPEGKGAGLELKAQGNYPTKAQRAFGETCQALGWPWFVIRSLEDLEDVLVELGVLAHQERLTDTRRTK